MCYTIVVDILALISPLSKLLFVKRFINGLFLALYSLVLLCFIYVLFKLFWFPFC